MGDSPSAGQHRSAGETPDTAGTGKSVIHLVELLGDLAATGSVSATARNLGLDQESIRRELWRANNLCDQALVSFAKGRQHDGIELSDAARTLLPADLQTCFTAFLARAGGRDRRFTGFQRRLQLLRRLKCRTSARNHLYGRIQAFRFGSGQVEVRTDIGGVGMAARIPVTTGHRLELAKGAGCDLLFHASDVRPALCPPSHNPAVNAIAARVLAAPDAAAGEMALSLPGGKRLTAEATRQQRLRLPPGTQVWALIPADAVTLLVDSADPVRTDEHRDPVEMLISRRPLPAARSMP